MTLASLASLARRAALALLASLTASGCAHPVVGTNLPRQALVGTDGSTHEVGGQAGARLTVLVFFAQHCPCQAAHDPRFVALVDRYRPQGVDFWVVDPEVGATPERDAEEAKRRGYPVPILLDPGGGVARRLGAEYATEAYVVDRDGRIRYHGGIDSDKKSLHADAEPYLQDALDDLLGGRPLRRAEAKTLGCSLQLW